MSVPCRFATCQMVSSARASTSWPSRVNFTVDGLGSILLIVSPLERIVGWAKPTGLAFGRPDDRLRVPTPGARVGTLRFAHPTACLPLPASERRLQLVRKILQHAHQRVWRCLAKSANRCVPHRGRQLAEQGLVPWTGRHQLRRLFRTRPAGGALAAALILEELHQIESHSLHVVPLRQYHNRMRPDETTIGLERDEIERQIRPAGSQYPTGCTAGQIGPEGMSVRHAAAVFLDQLAGADAGGGEP